MARWAVVLAGGSGTRFWPLSTREIPKQFLALSGDRPLLRQAIDRLRGVVPVDRLLVVTGERHAARTHELLPELPSENVLAEPIAASTGPALTWASHYVRARDPEATMISVHADWYVSDHDAFTRDAVTAFGVAEEHDVLVTIGIVPTRTEVAYGYIVPGAPLSGAARTVDRFVEKPGASLAASIAREGGLWNCGLFSWTVKRFFLETVELAPEIAPYIECLDRGEVKAFFDGVTPIPVDKSHFERSRRVAVVPASFDWDDIGSWTALSRVRQRDSDGNVRVGDVESSDSRDCIVWAANERVAIFGVTGLVVAQNNGVTLVTTREAAPKLKEFVEKLPPTWRDE